MTKPMKGYNPRERTCVQCGKTIITHNASEYLYKKRRKGVTYWFCGYGCMNQWMEDHPVKEHRSVTE